MHDLLWLLVIIVILIAVFGGATALALDVIWKILIILVVLAIFGFVWNGMRSTRRSSF